MHTSLSKWRKRLTNCYTMLHTVCRVPKYETEMIIYMPGPAGSRSGHKRLLSFPGTFQQTVATIDYLLLSKPQVQFMFMGCSSAS